MEPERLDEIPKIRIIPDDPPELTIEHAATDKTYIRHWLMVPDANVGREDFAPGETYRWAFWHPETHYILKGKAEITYTLAPWRDEKKTMTVEAGECYVIPRGAELIWKVVSEEPFQKLCVVMPREPLYDIRPKEIHRFKGW